MATNINDKQLLHECGEALIAIGHLPEAAHLFELANSYDDACQLYAQLKAWQKVQAILPNVTSLKLYAVYAKAKENEGKYLEAIESYKVAGEKDNAVRLYLDFLSDPHSAGEIVMETRSVDGSKMLARYCCLCVCHAKMPFICSYSHFFVVADFTKTSAIMSNHCISLFYADA